VGSVEKRVRNGAVTWLARWRDPDGRQRKRSFARRLDAQRYLTATESAKDVGTYVDPNGQRVLLADWGAAWLREQTHLRPSTRARYDALWRTHVAPRWGTVRLGGVRHADVQGWVSELTGKGLAPGTVRQAYRVLSLVLDRAVRDGRLQRNPAEDVTLPRQVRQEPRFLTPAQVRALADAAGPRWLEIEFLVRTGLRFGEFAALRVARVDLARRRVHIVESVSEVGGRLEWGPPKSHANRVVPLPPSLTEPLAERVTGRRPEELVFTAPHGGAVRLGNWRRDVFDRACRLAGVEGVSPHDLRHTAASLAIAAGASVKAVQRMLGHASAAMTLDVYAALWDDELDGVSDRLDALVPPRRPVALIESGDDEAAGA
jgi:integrase